MGNVAEFKHKTYTTYILQITYVDGTQETIESTLFGEMESITGYIGFSSTPADQDEPIPALIVRMDSVKSIRLLGSKEKIKK
jgi:hypothetical protein